MSTTLGDTADAAPGPTRGLEAARLPSYGEYLRAVLALGRRAIRPALPAIVFVYFYRLGMGLYMHLAPGGADLREDGAGSLAGFLTLAAGYLPMLVLVYTPFLPFLDGLARTGSASFLDAVKQVLEVAWQYLVSLVAQFAILLAPTALLIGIAASLTAGVSGGWVEHVRPGEQLANALRATILLVFLIPAFLWVLYAGIHLLFATPALVVSRRGPLAAIAVSWQLVGRNFWGILGRLFFYAGLLLLTSVVLSLPSAFLHVALTVSGSTNPAYKIPSVIWTSGVDAVLFPFGVAALLILYRALLPVPPAAGAEGAAPDTGRRTTSPFLFE
ncbi:MAG TPA: glycerophosphoryl diester phosphodiesterase membrane domain-containing protein [Candidatus Eisenbacteria bacterium]|jgi:hypothetical protein